MIKAQVLDGRIVGTGNLLGTPEQGVYELVGEVNLEQENTFELRPDGKLHITGMAASVAAIAANPSGYNDYKHQREAIKSAVAMIGYGNLSEQDRRLAAQWFALPMERIDEVLTLDEQLEAGELFDNSSKACRLKRYNAVFSLFRGTLPTAQAMKVAGIVEQYKLEQLYVIMGFEGKGTFNYRGEEDQASILDFFNSTPGTHFAQTGMDMLGLTPLKGLTVEQVKQRAISIIKTGA